MQSDTYGSKAPAVVAKPQQNHHHSSIKGVCIEATYITITIIVLYHIHQGRSKHGIDPTCTCRISLLFIPQPR